MTRKKLTGRQRMIDLKKSKDLNVKDTPECGPATNPNRLSAALTFNDRIGNIMCRISNNRRMKYKIIPGFYALGNPGRNSPVLVSCNYRLSMNLLRSALGGRDAWILVIDTKGINVWCAAGKGTFCSAEIVRQAAACDLKSRVTHRTLILPQLGASGVSASRVQKLTGFSVKFGPVRARDIPAYLDNSTTATPEMRQVGFSIGDRAKLIPMELIPALKNAGLFLLVATVLFGATGGGIIYKRAFFGVAPFVAAALTAVFTGSVLVPLLLPFIPGRAFSIKGFVTGCAGALALFPVHPECRQTVLFAIFCMVAVPAFSSYLAFLFTGSSTYTSPSGVKSELKIALPLYLASGGISLVLFMVILIRFWRFS